MSEDPRDVGILLKQERERRGILLEVVHETTKIPLDSLKAIEEGYKVRTLTAFYYKSFVKIYAQYLGLDASAVVAMIPTHHPKPAVPLTPLRPGAGRTASASGTGAHRVEGVREHPRSWNLLSHPIVLKKKKKVFKAVLIALLVFLGIAVIVLAVRKASSKGAASPRSVQAVPKPAVKPAAPKTVKTQKSADAAKTVSTKTAASATKTAAASAEVKVEAAPVTEDGVVKPLKRVSLTVRAQTTTWIKVVSDGAAVFQGHLKKGTASTWHGLKKIELSAKDIGALEFEVNGRTVGKLARRDLKAKKVVVTPEGLNVEK